MADFQDLVGEINSTLNDEEINNESISEQSEQDVGVEQDEQQREQAEIPAALLEAEAQHREEQERDRSSILMQNADDIIGDGYLLSPDTEYEALKRLWTQEVNATDLLKYDNNIIPTLLEMLPAQEEVIEQFQEQAHQGPSPSSENVDSDLASLAASICKMDLDRICFLLADLSRIRLEKIESYPFHLLQELDCMSEQELTYLSEYGQLFEKHMRRSVTDHIPKDAWKKLDEADMIDRPNFDNYVFCKVVHKDGVVINNHKGIEIDQDEETNGVEPERHYDSGSCLFARYGVVQDLVVEGKVDLLI